MDSKYLEEIKAREQAATKGPWQISGDIKHLVCAKENQKEYDGPPIVANCGVLYHSYTKQHIKKMQKNVEFIAHARTDIPALIAEVERLRGVESELAYEKLANKTIPTMNNLIKRSADKIGKLADENSTLKNALLKSCEFMAENLNCESPLSCCKDCQGDDDCAIHLYEYFLKQAQEENK